jgi:hypothetical protein
LKNIVQKQSIEGTDYPIWIWGLQG